MVFLEGPSAFKKILMERVLAGLPVLVILKCLNYLNYLRKKSHHRVNVSMALCLPVQKNTHYMMIFDAFVILTCLASLVLCARSVIRGLQLQQVSAAPQDTADALSHTEAHGVSPLPNRSLSTSSFFTTRRKFRPLIRWSSSTGGTL